MPETTTIITSEELRYNLSRLGIEPYNLVVLDRVYQLPNKSWFINQFREALAANLAALGLAQYKSESWDCDDFALLSVALAKMNHALNGNNKATGIAIGMTFYNKEQPRGRHAVVVAVTKPDEVAFLEPNGCLPIRLSDAEISSITDLVI